MALSLEQAFSRLEESHRHNRLGHAYLLAGPRGAGKEQLACRLIGLLHQRPAPASLDEAVGDGVRVVRPASKSRRITVDNIHELENTLRLTISRNPVKVGVIVDADRMVVNAENAFLKTLEEPPKNSVLLLLSTQHEQLLPTILSRCLKVVMSGPLRVPSREDSPEAGLLQLLRQHGTLAQRGVVGGLALARGFTLVLEACKEKIAARHKAAFAEETAAVRKATESGDWIEGREDAMKAQVEADYLGERNHLMNTLVSWFGDAVRVREGGVHLDLPECRESITKLADATSTMDLLARQQQMVRLHMLFETNTSEALAIEVCFLRAFG